MINFKACPRCQGDMSLDSDQYGWFMECLQCGYEEYIQGNPTKPKTPQPAPERVAMEAV